MRNIMKDSLLAKTFRVVPWQRLSFRKGQRVINAHSVWAHQEGYTDFEIPIGTVVPSAMIFVVSASDPAMTIAFDAQMGLKTTFDTRKLALVEPDEEKH
jgi:hypothetical protein